MFRVILRGSKERECLNDLSKAADAHKTETAETAREAIRAKRPDSTADEKELEGKIDRRVWRLYDLTEDEINIVERKA